MSEVAEHCRTSRESGGLMAFDKKGSKMETSARHHGAPSAAPLALLLLCAGLAGCGGGSDLDPEASNAPSLTQDGGPNFAVATSPAIIAAAVDKAVAAAANALATADTAASTAATAAAAKTAADIATAAKAAATAAKATKIAAATAVATAAAKNAASATAAANAAKAAASKASAASKAATAAASAAAVKVTAAAKAAATAAANADAAATAAAAAAANGSASAATAAANKAATTQASADKAAAALAAATEAAAAAAAKASLAADAAAVAATAADAAATEAAAAKAGAAAATAAKVAVTQAGTAEVTAATSAATAATKLATTTAAAAKTAATAAKTAATNASTAAAKVAALGGTMPATPTTTPTTTPGSSLVSDVEPSCTSCGALSATVYSGSGVGIWHKKNTGTIQQDVKVSIGGINNKNVALIVTNETASDVALAGAALLSSVVQPLPLYSRNQASAPLATAMEAVQEFNRTGWAKFVSAPRPGVRHSMASPPPPSFSVVGDTRSFYDTNNSARATTLSRQVTLPSGQIVRFWVETSEAVAGKVTSTIVDQLVQAFTKTGGIYDMLLDIGGPLWGAHSHTEMISGVGQPLDIVMLNFDRNHTPNGVVGYFYAQNNFKKTSLPFSNESLSLYLDTETMYLDGSRGMQSMLMTMAHEGMHMANYYRRGVKMGQEYGYSTWLEEMTAMLMEDAVSTSVSETFNSIRDERLPYYLSSPSYNCPLLIFTGMATPCEGYSISGSFGGFLLRQLGLPFYRNLLSQANTDSVAALQAAIQVVRPQSGIGEELRKFAVSAIAVLPASTAPAGYGFPSRSDGNYSIPVIDAAAAKVYRVLPSVMPSTLKGYGNFPIVQPGVAGTFTRTVRVPAGASLSVVVN